MSQRLSMEARLASFRARQRAESERRNAAWLQIKKVGGLLPSSQEGLSGPMRHALGVFEQPEVERIIEVALPKLPSIDRRWPWIARAAFNYKENYWLFQRFPLRRNADSAVEAIFDHARGLQQAIMDLGALNSKLPGAIGRENFEKALAVRGAIEAALGGLAGSNQNSGVLCFEVQLEKLLRACEQHRARVGGKRLRGASNPCLDYLVEELSIFWVEATGRKPSAARPSRRDGNDAPFVRLVNGCAELARAPHATSKQVQRSLANLSSAP